MLAFPRHLLLPRAKLGPLDINLPQLRVQTVEKARDVLRLRGHPLSRLADDLGIQSELLRDVDARRSAWHPYAQLERGGERVLIEADGPVQHARRVRRVNLATDWPPVPNSS